MPSSGVSVFQNTTDQIIEQAIRLAGGIGTWETPNALEQTQTRLVLNTMIKAFHSTGMPLWSIKEIGFTTSAFTNGKLIVGAVSPGNGITAPLKILQAWRRSQEIDVELLQYTNIDYNNLSNKFTTGTPTGYTYQVFENIGNLIIWPLPDAATLATTSIFIRAQFPFEDNVSGTETLDFPSYWEEAIVYNLALRIAPRYGAPIFLINHLKEMAVFTKKEAESFDTEEGSFTIIPETR